MEAENMISSKIIKSSGKEEEDDVPLPGFRFHPTDEELVGFYLRRKVEKRPLSIELIKQVDIYKYDPWDLPKSSNVGDKECYFFCKRGRKYRNSVRPNRVITGSGFWKATGIDKQIYSSEGSRDCIGLKKSLVYYRGSAGKGTKTDWMMHEFRLPPVPDKTATNLNPLVDVIIAREAEVWTLCRILKRNSASQRRLIPTDWKESAARRNGSVNINPTVETSSETCSVESCNKNSYNISFSTIAAPLLISQFEKKPYSYDHDHGNLNNPNHQYLGSVAAEVNEFLRHSENWEDLQSIVNYAASSSVTHATNTTAGPFY